MKCRILSVLLIAAILMNSALIPISAAAEVVPTVGNIAYGYLTDENGNAEVVEGRLINTVAPASIGGAAKRTYAFDLYETENILTAKGKDGALSSIVYLTIEYLETDEYPASYLLTAVSGHWEIKVSNVQIESATLNYGCSGTGREVHSALLSQTNTLPVQNYFSYNTGFDKYVCDFGFAANVGAYLDLHYLMGTTRRWTFTLNNYRLNY